jgi:hypothetical protein
LSSVVSTFEKSLRFTAIFRGNSWQDRSRRLLTDGRGVEIGEIDVQEWVIHLLQ